MAPKRTTAAGNAAPAKKAKTAAPEAPLLAFLAAAKDIPKPCRDMLRVAMPICLEVVEGERHKFQVEILSRIAGLLSDVESKKRGAVSAVESELAQFEAEKAKASAEAEAKKATASSKQNECDEKGKIVDAAREVVANAQQVLTTAQQQEEAFNTKKAELFVEQERFAKLLTDVFQPLKDGTLAGNWQVKKKAIGELKKKLLELGAQESLADALEVALKAKPEQREGAFTKATMQFTEEMFAKHTAKVELDISGLDPEAATLKDAIVAAEAALAVEKGKLEVVSKEWDEMQDVWLQLEKVSADAASALSSIEFEIPLTKENIETAKADLEKFLELPALFQKLKDGSPAVPEEAEAAEEAKEGAEAAAEVANDDGAMQA